MNIRYVPFQLLCDARDTSGETQDGMSDGSYHGVRERNLHVNPEGAKLVDNILELALHLEGLSLIHFEFLSLESSVRREVQVAMSSKSLTAMKA